MFSLFWKIFLTYWLTILLIELFTAWFSVDLSESEIHPILERQNAEFVANSTMAVSILTTDGLPGLSKWFRNKNNHKAIDDIYIFNQDNQEVNDKALPNNVKAILRNNTTTNAHVTHYQPLKNTLSFNTVSPEGDSYLLVSTFEHPPAVNYLLAPQRVAFGVIVSGLICFLLARYFTSPLQKLRSSTKRLSEGDFQTVGLDQLRNRTDEFGALAEDFDTMATRLNHLLDSQQQLLRDISHELRSPLTRIQVALDLARKKLATATNDELDRIETEIGNLEYLIRELLTFVKIDAYEKKNNMAKVDICELLHHIVDDINYVNQQDNPESNISIDSPKCVNVQADVQLLHRAVENIIRNANYYSPQNAAINIRCRVSSDHVTIEIEDNGPGVPEEMLEKIFEPFVRVSSAREADTGGSGIGLAIARRIIDIHEGKIKAENKIRGSGLIISITLPIQSD